MDNGTEQWPATVTYPDEGESVGVMGQREGQQRLDIVSVQGQEGGEALNATVNCRTDHDANIHYTDVQPQTNLYPFLTSARTTRCQPRSEQGRIR